MIDPGQVADLLVIDGDPLESIGALRDPVQVLRAGRAVLDWPAIAETPLTRQQPLEHPAFSVRPSPGRSDSRKTP